MGVDHNQKLLEENTDILNLKSMGLKTALDSSSIDLKPFDFIVISPGIPPTHPLQIAAKAQNKEIIGEVELACRNLKPKLFLGITGTNGKTTVTLMTAHILKHAGKKAYALGNVGVPITSQETHDADAIIIAELSSYQIETLHSKIIDAAVILNITPDHLDRYHSMQEYALAKLHIANCLKKGGMLFLEKETDLAYGHLLAGPPIETYGYQSHCDFHTDLQHIYFRHRKICSLPVPLQGKKTHDLENFLAAFALCQRAGITPQQFLDGFATFKKPAHRIEFVTKVNEVSYYDDSKGTNLDAVIRAVESVTGPVILIAGGMDKGAPYTPWIKAFNGKVKLICAIGQAAEKIVKDLSSDIPVKQFQSLEEAVKHAVKEARAGDNVMLSPGCSSLDMFKDYAHRGQEFQRIVKEIHR